MNETIPEQQEITDQPSEVSNEDTISRELLTIITITVVIAIALGVLYYFEQTSSFVTDLSHNVAKSFIK